LVVGIDNLIASQYGIGIRVGVGVGGDDAA
jgi:hypothetical protein